MRKSDIGKANIEEVIRRIIVWLELFLLSISKQKRYMIYFEIKISKDTTDRLHE